MCFVLYNQNRVQIILYPTMQCYWNHKTITQVEERASGEPEVWEAGAGQRVHRNKHVNVLKMQIAVQEDCSKQTSSKQAELRAVRAAEDQNRIFSASLYESTCRNSLVLSMHRLQILTEITSLQNTILSALKYLICTLLSLLYSIQPLCIFNNI